jgi:ABC-type sugar transport system substrate-binding protein
LKKFIPLIAIAMASLVFLVGCAPATPPGPAKYAIIFKNTGNPYGEKQMQGFKDAVTEFGGEGVGDRLVHDETVGSGAGLANVAHLGEHRSVYRSF